MIQASHYLIIFDIIVAISTILLLGKYRNNRSFEIRRPFENRLALYLSIFFAVFIGLRPINAEFVDMTAYAELYKMLPVMRVDYTLDTNNKIFDNLLLYLSRSRVSLGFFFCFIAAIYYVGSFFAIKRIFRVNVLAAYLVWLGSFSTFSYGVNGLKAGAAAALFLLAISFYDKKIIAILFALVSLGFHHSMIVCIVAFVAVKLFKKSNYYLGFWFFCLVMAILHVTAFQILFSNFSDEQGTLYLMKTGGDDFGGRGGFRLDFVLYSALPVIIGCVALFKKKLLSQKYTYLFNFYLLTNSVWLLCMYASFTNRIAYLSWFIYPIVLIYPLLEMKWGRDKVEYFWAITLFNLVFTLFMGLVYY